jgi:peptidoglycan/xylan/chitin deacetylase (PgdA/CDA1 family)
LRQIKLQGEIQKMKPFTLYLMTAAALLLIGCGDSGSDGAATENDEASCADTIDNDGDGATDCDDVQCAAFCSLDTDGDTAETDGSTDAQVSDMPIPPTSSVAKPDGAAENLKVLDWAGFKAAVSYTFDDSQPSQMDHYDELQEGGIRMTFFAGQGFGGGSAYDELWTQAVADGHEIGNHTAHHCHIDSAGTTLGTCGAGSAADSADAEITEAADYFAEHFGQAETYTLASPYGDSGWGKVAPSYVFLNRSVSNGTVKPNGTSNPFSLPARMLNGGETVDDLNGYIDSVYDKGEWMIYCIHSILPTSQNWYAGVDIESITGNIDYVKSLGDGNMWADTMENVGAYWVGQKLLTDATPAAGGDNTVWTWTLPDHFPPGKFVRVTVDGGTLTQGGRELTWSDHGYYEVSLDEGELTLTP